MSVRHRAGVPGAAALALLAGIGLAAAHALGSPVRPAWSAAPTQAACAGVTVVVDFGASGGVRTGCAPGNPASGLDALESAGFGYAFVPRQPGMVCQIDGLPNPCNGAPKDAYWAYWHARPGGSWVYSDEGAASYDPVPGSFEGWAFGAGRRPGIAPPAAPAPPPPAPPASNPAATDPDQPSPSASGSSASASPTPTPVPTSGAPTAAYQSTLEVSPVAAPRAGGHTGLPWEIGVLLIAGITGLAIWRVRQRRG